LSTTTLIHVYKALIGSLFNYSAFCANQASQFWLKKLQVIQNSAIRAIYKLPYDTATEDLLGIAAGNNLEDIRSRMFTLKKRYLSRANIHDNPILKKKLVEEYRRGFDGRSIHH
jgi:hypothetical protein